MNYYINAFKKMTDFKSRTSRKEFWIFYLINALIVTIICLVGVFLISVVSEEMLTNVAILVFLVFFIYLLVLLLPTIAITIRRLHDAGFSGWLMLLYFLPYIGGWVLIILSLFPSKLGENKYGPNPYGENLEG